MPPVVSTASDVAAPGAHFGTQSSHSVVELADGTSMALDGLSADDLGELQWQQERAFAQRIVAAPKRSAARHRAVQTGYDTVTSIIAQWNAVMQRDRSLAMGWNHRYQRLVLELMRRQQRRDVLPLRLFEIGFGSGTLLDRIRRHGFDVGGIEVSPLLVERACATLGKPHCGGLYLGNLLDHPLDGPHARYSLVYWNDVLEHIAPDEALDYLRRIHQLLAPGGQLVTITPNWHERPNDVTAAFCPPRTTAVGLHLKEYTLGEVVQLLLQAGFRQVATPLLVTRGRLVLCGSGLRSVKTRLEPALEWLPFRLARLACRAFGMYCTIATRTAE